RVADDHRQLLAPGLADQTAVVQAERWLVRQRVRQHRAEIVERCEIRARRPEKGGPERLARAPDVGERCQAVTKPHEIARMSDAQRSPAGEALDVADLLQRSP